MANDKKFVVKNGLTTQNVSFVNDITNPTTTQTITLTDVGNWNTAYGWGNHASSGYLTSETVTSLSLATNILTYTDENGTTTNLDLSLYLDDTNLARLVSGSLDGGTGIATFTRDDATTFTVDFSPFFDDTNLARITSASFGTGDGVLTLTRDDSSTVTVDLDGRYLEDAPSDGNQYARQDGSWAIVTGGGGGAASLNELSDVVISSPASGELLYYDGSNFVNTSTTNLNILTSSDLANSTNVEDVFSTNGSAVNFLLSEAPATKENILVTVDGVVQPTSSYTLSNLTLTLSPAIASGSEVRVLHLKPLMAEAVKPKHTTETSVTLTAANMNSTMTVTNNVTVNNNVGTAGDSVLIYNNSSSDILIIAGTITTMRLAGTETVGTRTLSGRGLATIFYVSPTEVTVGGSGLT